MTKVIDEGAGASATPSGSREPSPSGLGPPGFDPSRFQAVSHDRARESALRFIDSFFNNGARRVPQISIPADPASDDDLLLCRFIAEQAGIERALRIRVWNDCRNKGMSDSASYAEIRRVIEEARLQEPTIEDPTPASAIEARSAETLKDGSVHESAVAESQTPNPSLRTITSQGGTR
jgi:hypothetical protein